MIIAALCISILSLMIGTAALTINITTQILKPKIVEVPNALSEPSDAELKAFFEGQQLPINSPAAVLKDVADKKFEEMMENPDARFTGIDEEFNV